LINHLLYLVGLVVLGLWLLPSVVLGEAYGDEGFW